MPDRAAIFELDNFCLDNYHVKLNEVLFHNANGYIGVRYDLEEGYPGEYDVTPSQYINGFYDFAKTTS
jgi:alpha,alpha-trehalose phosphorylase